ncbi:MAG: ABC transporter ATP-binding protein [Clostridiales bacterium]|nr:ABC transporter ATP-binding protein [Clostridiales bacterium]
MKNKSILKPYIIKHKWKYIFGVITLFVVDFANLYVPEFTGKITDGLDSGAMTMDNIRLLIIQILILGTIIAIGRFLWRYFIFGGSRLIEYELRNDLFNHLEGLSANFFNKNKTGDLMAHFTNDFNAIRMAIGPAVVTTFDATILTTMVIIKMISHVNLQLTIVAVIPMLLILIGGIFFGKEIEKRFKEKQEAFSNLTDEVQESISGIRVIKGFVQESKDVEKFSKSNLRNKEKNIRVVRLTALVLPLIDVIIGVSIVVTILYGGRLALSNQITIGEFVAFTQYIFMLVWPMIAVGESINLFSQGIASLKRIEKILDVQAEVYDDENVDTTVERLEGDIEFRNLTFKYNENLPNSLTDISFKVKRGQTLAIVGPTGSGKSTIASLLVRLYNTEPGTIFLDNRDIREIPLKVLRENIAFVPQESFMFSDTIANNIAFGSDNNDIEKIKKAAKDASVHNNIMDFPLGYETIVGERGVTLSGGQKQRCSIARALMKDAPILILDDSLSAVDTDTEEIILSNLKKNRQGKTTIIIAHRISTIQNSDLIIVMEEGKIKESGSHDELLEQRGIYWKIYNRQQLEKQIGAS